LQRNTRRSKAIPCSHSSSAAANTHHRVLPLWRTLGTLHIDGTSGTSCGQLR
jgi:hypothetical protein